MIQCKRYKFFVFLTTFLLSSAFISMVKAQITVTVNVVGSSSTKTADWTGQFRKNRVLVTVVNPRLQVVEGTLRVQLLNGSGTVIAETIDDQQALQQFSNGSTLLDLSEVLPQYGNAYRLNDESLREKLNNGFIPEDNYQVCVNIIDVSTLRPILPSPICKAIRVIGYQAPILVFPPDQGEVRVGQRPILRWNGVSPRPTGTVKYRLQVFEIAGSQSPEIAFRANVPYVDEIITNQTQWIWGSSYELPRAGISYVWGVQALDEDDKPIGEPNGQAAPFIFKVPQASAADKKAVDDVILAEKPLDKGKIRFAGIVKDNVIKSKVLANATVTINYTGTEVKYRKKTETYTETVPGRETKETQSVNPNDLNNFISIQQRQGKVVNVLDRGSVRIFPPRITMARVEVITRGTPTTAQRTRQVDEPYTEKASKTAEVTTDGSGKFSFDVEDGQSLTLSGKVKGYFDGKPEKAQVSVGAGSKVISGFALFLDPKAGKIEGILTNAQTKRGIQGVIVEAFKASDTKKAVASGTTNGNGQFSFNAEVGDYVLKVNNEQYEVFTSRNINVRPEETVKSDIILKPFTASIAGKIIDNTNKPVAGAKVAVYTQSEIDAYLYGNNSTPFTEVITTVADGSYEINDIAINKVGLENESYVVFATAEGYSEAWKAVPLRKGGDRIQADLKLNKRSSLLSGTVTDDKGDKVSKVKVEVYTATGTLYKSVMTDANGNYTLKDIPTTPKLDKIVFSRDGWSTETATGTFREFKSLYVVDMKLTRNPPITVRGKIKNQFGEDFEGVTVTCDGKTATTDKQGKFVIENTSIFTQKKLTLSKAGETKEVSFTTKLSPSWELEETLLEYKRTVALKFVDEAGNPLAGVSFTLKDADGKEVGNEKLSGAEWSKLIYGNTGWVGKKLTLSWTHPTKDTENRNIDIKNKDWFVSKTALSYTLIEKTITIRGRITNKETGAGVEGVTVSVNGSNFSAQTDINGNYSIPKVPFQERWQLKGEKRNYTSNVLDVNNPFKITEVPKSPTIDNQNFTLKINFVNPETIFGFKATITSFREAPQERFIINGTLDVPNESEIQTTIKKIDFKDITVDNFGVPISTSIRLGSTLAVTVNNVPATMSNVNLVYVNNSGSTQISPKGQGIGVVSGTITIENREILDSRAKIPDLVVRNTSGSIPLGIRSSGSYGTMNIASTNGRDVETDFKSVKIKFAEGTMDRQGITLLLKELMIGGAPIKSAKAFFQENRGRWQSTGIEGTYENRVENARKRHLFTLGGTIKYSENDGFSMEKPTLKLLMIDKSNASFVEGQTLKINENGNFSDQEAPIAFKFDFMGMELELQTGQGITSKIATKGKGPELSFGVKLFEDLFEEAPQVIFAMSAHEGVKVELANIGVEVGKLRDNRTKKGKKDDKTNKMVMQITINRFVVAWGGTGGDIIDIDTKVLIGLSKPNSKGALYVGGTLAIKVTEKNGVSSYQISKMGVAFGLPSGLQLGGEVSFPENGPLSGEFLLGFVNKSANKVEINAKFSYSSPEEFSFSLYVETSKPIATIGAVAIIGLGGKIERKSDIWVIGINGTFIPSATIKDPRLIGRLEAEVIFGGGEFAVKAAGTIEIVLPNVKNFVFGEANVIVDFNKKLFEGSVKVGVDKRPLLGLTAQINAYFDFAKPESIDFQVSGFADATVLGVSLASMRFSVGFSNSNDRRFFSKNVADLKGTLEANKTAKEDEVIEIQYAPGNSDNEVKYPLLQKKAKNFKKDILQWARSGSKNTNPFGSSRRILRQSGNLSQDLERILNNNFLFSEWDEEDRNYKGQRNNPFSREPTAAERKAEIDKYASHIEKNFEPALNAVKAKILEFQNRTSQEDLCWFFLNSTQIGNVISSTDRGIDFNLPTLMATFDAVDNEIKAFLNSPSRTIVGRRTYKVPMTEARREEKAKEINTQIESQERQLQNVINRPRFISFDFQVRFGHKGDFSSGPFSGGYDFTFSGNVGVNANEFNADFTFDANLSMWGQATFGPWEPVWRVKIPSITVGAGAGVSLTAKIAVRNGSITTVEGIGKANVKAWAGVGANDCCSPGCNSACGVLTKLCGKAQGCFDKEIGIAYNGSNWSAFFK